MKIRLFNIIEEFSMSLYDKYINKCNSKILEDMNDDFDEDMEMTVLVHTQKMIKCGFGKKIRELNKDKYKPSQQSKQIVKMEDL